MKPKAKSPDKPALPAKFKPSEIFKQGFRTQAMAHRGFNPGAFRTQHKG